MRESTVRVLGLARGDIDRPSPPVLAQRRPGRERRRLDTWHPTDLVGQGRPHVRRLPLTRPVDVQQQNALRLESQRPVRQVPQRRGEQTGDEEHEETERHLPADQRAHETTVGVRVLVTLDAPSGVTADARRAGAIPNSTVTVSVSARLNATERQSTSSTNRIGSPIWASSETTNGAAHQAKRAPTTDAQIASSALRRAPAESAASAGANRHAQRHLAGASDGLSGEQVGDVRAGDEQHEHDEPGEDEQRTPECTLRAGCTASCGGEEDLLVK